MSNTMDNSTDGFATTVTILVPIHICIGIATVFGNALVIILTLRNKALKKTTDILIGSLACIDAFVGLFGTPVIILNMYYVLYVGDGWLACVICPILFIVPMLSDLGVMLLILSERYRAIVQYHKPPYTTKQVVYMLMGVFVMSLALCGNYVLSYVTGSSCGGHDPTFIDNTLFIICVWPLFGITIVCYSKIKKNLQSQTVMGSNRSRQSQQVINSVLACLFLYFIGIIPNMIALEISLVAKDFYGTTLLGSTRVLFFSGLTIGLLNSMANPIIYAIFNRTMR